MQYTCVVLLLEADIIYWADYQFGKLTTLPLYSGFIMFSDEFCTKKYNMQF